LRLAISEMRPSVDCMFEFEPLALNTPVHRTLAEVQAGSHVPQHELTEALYGPWVDFAAEPPKLSLEGEQLLAGLGPYKG
jgi:hypothetical protein